MNNLRVLAGVSSRRLHGSRYGIGVDLKLLLFLGRYIQIRIRRIHLLKGRLIPRSCQLGLLQLWNWLALCLLRLLSYWSLQRLKVGWRPLMCRRRKSYTLLSLWEAIALERGLLLRLLIEVWSLVDLLSWEIIDSFSFIDLPLQFLIACIS